MAGTGRTRIVAGIALLTAAGAAPAAAQQAIDRARDRGAGIPTSMFGIYIEPGQVLLYPFFEYYRDSNAEYKPAELGYGLDRDFRAKYRASEGLIFLGWGISDRLAIEFEAAVISATQHKSPSDTSAMPARLEESGLGDVEGQLRWRWNRESESRPEIFSYFETVFPLQKAKKLIGTQDWELKLGAGVVRGFGWGTGTVRFGLAWAEGAFELGEYAVEYLRRVSPLLRVYAGIEGSEDEVELITETQWTLAPRVLLRLNSAFGLTSKAADWAPEVGLLFTF
jgi:hypothetical protein